MTDTPANKPFGVEHVQKVCRDILYPPKVARKSLRWGFRLNSLDLMSSHDFRWPFPGHWAEAQGPILDHRGDCPTVVGNGLCVAHTLAGASSGGARLGRSIGLLVAYVAKDVLGESADKTRAKRVWVAEVFDPVRAARESGADLSRTNLTGADLSWSDFRGSNFCWANLSRTSLHGANLAGGALRWSDLRWSDLTAANLTGADLTGADLARSDLYAGALSGSDLRGANLYGATLTMATYSTFTVFPEGLDPGKHRMVKV